MSTLHRHADVERIVVTATAGSNVEWSLSTPKPQSAMGGMGMGGPAMGAMGMGEPKKGCNWVYSNVHKGHTAV